MSTLAKNKTKITFVTDEDFKKALKAYGEEHHWSLSQTVEILMKEFFQLKQQQLDGSKKTA